MFVTFSIPPGLSVAFATHQLLQPLPFCFFGHLFYSNLSFHWLMQILFQARSNAPEALIIIFFKVSFAGSLSRLVYLFIELLLYQSILYTVSYLFIFCLM